MPVRIEVAVSGSAAHLPSQPKPGHVSSAPGVIAVDRAGSVLCTYAMLMVVMTVISCLIWMSLKTYNRMGLSTDDLSRLDLGLDPTQTLLLSNSISRRDHLHEAD